MRFEETKKNLKVLKDHGRTDADTICSGSSVIHKHN